MKNTINKKNSNKTYIRINSNTTENKANNTKEAMRKTYKMNPINYWCGPHSVFYIA